MSSETTDRSPRAVIVTALSLEFKAVRAHIQNIKRTDHPKGTVYDVGTFKTRDGLIWEVCIVEIGAGNPSAAAETERAIEYFDPQLIMFVGVAGGLKDVSIGDVVAANKVYGYESGKAEQVFYPRSVPAQSSYDMVQRARSEARQKIWTKRIRGQRRGSPVVLVAPIASGEKVVANQHSAIWKFIRQEYSDAIAVEMEGRGFLEASYAHRNVSALIVRGISDLIDGKREADSAGSQVLAANHASAFAFEIISHFIPAGFWPRTKTTDRANEESPLEFREDSRINALIRSVRIEDEETSANAALSIVNVTDSTGKNDLFESLLNYQNSPGNDDSLWQALATIESCADLAPHLFGRSVLARMANHPNYSVRSCASSICMRFAQYAPQLVPIDILIKLSVYNEDWYVEALATAALKSMVRAMPPVLSIFLNRLHSSDPDEVEHAAYAIASIANEEPELLDSPILERELSRLRSAGQKSSSALLAEALVKARKARRIFRYKYGI